MDLKLKIAALSVFAALAAGIYIGKQFFPKIIETQVEREVVRKDIVTVTKEVVRPDGTKEITTTSTDKSVQKNDKSTTVVKAESMWRVSSSVSRSSLNSANIYGITVERRLLGNVFGGITANTENTVGLVVGLEL